MTATPTGLFVGTASLDVVYLVDHLPRDDEKLVASDFMMAAGGPATNAAVCFAALGGDATLLTRIGDDPVGQTVKADLDAHGVRVVDAAAPGARAAVSTILVNASTGQRTVVSTAGASGPASGPGERGDFDVVCVDSYELDLSLPAMRAARRRGIPVILDVGAKKPWTNTQLPHVDVAIVAANYLPGGTPAIAADLAGVPVAAITAGPLPVQWWMAADPAIRRIEVPAVATVDTLAAGDFFHGAFAFSLACGPGPGPFGGPGPAWEDSTIERCLRRAVEVAALSVQSFGSRRWLEQFTPRLA